VKDVKQSTGRERNVVGKKITSMAHNLFARYKQMAKNESHHIMLESLLGGRYSMIGLRPFAILQGSNEALTITENGVTTSEVGDPLLLMQRWMEQYRTAYDPNLPDFQGGAIGYISYDYVRNIEKLPQQSSDDLSIPTLYFLVFNDVIVYDHQEDELWIIVNEEDNNKGNKRLAELEAALNEQPIASEWKAIDKIEKPFAVSLTEDTFKEAVEKIKQYISAGDVFQVNLSVRQGAPLKTDPMHIYEKLRELNPSPYMGYMHVPEFQLVSGSPELLVKKKGKELSTRPIAGTRSRGKDDAEDQRLANELISNEKERAEHVMLVDLERNDLGRVCKYGTVEVDEFMTIEKYSHVMHIVSNVKGEIAEEFDAYDAIRATFPGGTITGAPKIRTMEIIEELEPVQRGVYTGSIGWIGFNGDMELNIAIRTMVAKDGMAYVQAGAGIVIDSVPSSEYKESLKKAKALWKAKELSEQEVSANDINDR
jgi:para-aminobenzoate synthetase component I